MTHVPAFVNTLYAVMSRPDVQAGIERILTELVSLRARGGRLFVIGVGGGAANAAHAVNDFRKLCHIEAYTPTDSVAELTARANDEGWRHIFTQWLMTSRFVRNDALLVFSVGGGTETVSACIYDAVNYSLAFAGASVLAVVGRPDGAATRRAVASVVTGLDGPLLTPITETVQVAVLHALVSDPRLQVQETKW